MNTFRFSLRAIIAPLALFYLVSCKEKEEPPSVSPIAEPDTAQVLAVEDAYPGVECVWQNGTLFGQPIRYGIINNEAIYEGDIILTPEQLAPVESPNGRTSGAGVFNKINRWRNFTIPYTIDSDLPNKSRITSAIAHWEKNTPLRFVPRTHQVDYVAFVKGPGCASNFGRIRGRQTIELASGCNTGAVIHEIGHTVGLLHEQTRSDRDNFVTIHEDNIISNDKDQFLKYTDDDEISGFKFGDYDFNSVMHYPWNAFAKDKTKPTITRNDGGGNLTFGNRNELSNIDKQTVVSMYANLYIMWKGRLFAVCVKDGSFAMITDGWDGFNAETMAEDDTHIWFINGETLYRMNRFNGLRTPFGGGWNGATGITSILNNNTLWAIKGNDLFAINRQGQRTRVTDRNWNSAQAIIAHKDYILVARSDNKLARLDLNTKEVIVLNSGNWFDVRGMAVTSSSSHDLYIVQGNTLWRVDIDSGAFTPVSHGWSGTEAMAGVDGSLYIVQGGTLWKVDTNGNRQSLGGGWSGTQSMGVVRNSGLLL